MIRMLLTVNYSSLDAREPVKVLPRKAVMFLSLDFYLKTLNILLFYFWAILHVLYFRVTFEPKLAFYFLL